MHEVFKIKSLKPIPKIAQKPLWFWKTPNFAKIPKTYASKNEMHENEGLETYQVKKNLINLKKCLRKRLREKEECLGGEQPRIDRERLRKWSLDRIEPIYRSSVILDR